MSKVVGTGEWATILFVEWGLYIANAYI